MQTGILAERSAVARRAGVTLAVRSGLIAGLVAAVVEMIPIALIQGAMGVSLERVLQSIASGWTGAAAYQGGLGSALLGAFFHTLISLVAGVAFALAAIRWPMLLRRPIVWGIAYGFPVYIVMNFIVVPLSRVAFAPTTEPAMMALSFAIQVFAFTVPIALVCRRLMRDA